MKKFLKREPVAPRLLTANGTPTGLVTIVDTIGFRTGALVVIRAGSIGLRARIRDIVSTTQLILESEDRLSAANLSAFTVLAGAAIEQIEETYAPEQEDGELFSSVYESHPVSAIRTTSVDPYGNPYTPDNPLPVNASVTVVVPPVTVDIDAMTPPTRPDPDNLLIVGSEDGTKSGLKHAARVDSDLDVRVGISNGANKAAVSGAGDLSVRDSNIDALLSTRATEATLSAVNTKLNSLGQKPMAGSVPVVMATDQSPIPVTATLADEPLKISGTIDGQPNGTEFTFVNNLKLQILDSHNRVAAFTYADFGTKNQRVTMIDYVSATFPGTTVRRQFAYTLVGNNYRRDSETWTIV